MNIVDIKKIQKLIGSEGGAAIVVDSLPTSPHHTRNGLGTEIHLGHGCRCKNGRNRSLRECGLHQWRRHTDRLQRPLQAALPSREAKALRDWLRNEDHHGEGRS